MARPLKPLVKSGGYYPTNRWTPLVYPGGRTTQGGGVEPTPEVWKTVSGAIASFETQIAWPLRKLEATIDPIQDLHGYEYPWPAGGGKNQCYNDASHLFPRGDGLAIVENADTYTAYAKVPTNTDIVFSCATAPYRSIAYGFESLPAVGVVGHVLEKTSLTTTSFKFNSGSYPYVGFYYGATGYTNSKIMIEVGTSASTFAPYSNLCHISGRTGCEVDRTGVNVWDEETQVGYYNSGTGQYVSYPGQLCSKNFTPVKPNMQYLFRKAHSLGDVLYYNLSKELIGSVINRPANYVFTTPENCYFIKMNLGSNYGSTYNHDIGINYPATDTAYHAYQGETIPISWQDEAGTVYGGTLDVTTGLLTVDRASTTVASNNVSNNGKDTTYNNYRAWYNVTGRALTTNVLSNIFVVGSPSEPWTISPRTTEIGIEFRLPFSALNVSPDDNPTTVMLPAAKQWFSDNPTQLVYELATPQTYQLDPVTVQTLLGQNNVWADCGDVEAEYRES